MPAKGRRDGAQGPHQDTVPAKSAQQAILLKQDIILDALAAVRDAADLATAQTALSNLDLEKVDLK